MLKIEKDFNHNEQPSFCLHLGLTKNQTSFRKIYIKK